MVAMVVVAVVVGAVVAVEYEVFCRGTPTFFAVALLQCRQFRYFPQRFALFPIYFFLTVFPNFLTDFPYFLTILDIFAINQYFNHCFMIIFP